ncbi:MAG: glycosyltransferase family 9 protein [Bacteroidetes bacterium]|nr:glycosyltransferase family 9 protein [Bacteroidota bacterium]
MNSPRKILLVQTAFIGDVILATALVEKLHSCYPDCKIDFLVRKGNESLLSSHPHIHRVWFWDKKQNKIKNLLSLILLIRRQKYDTIINAHRFASSGLICAMSGAKEKVGFDKNPLSIFFTRKVKHSLYNGLHETQRNQMLIAHFTDDEASKPKLYPSADDFAFISQYQTQEYCCMAPTSVWFTKQLPLPKWVMLCNKIKSGTIYLLGAPTDFEACESIRKQSENVNIVNLAGKLSLLQSAALMQGATMCYVNDSAPLHIASSMNAPVTAFFCSTIPAFGFGPLSTSSRIVEATIKPECRPCGIHGYKQCPKGHFKCAEGIEIESL